jgi:hypothetical protein
MLHTMPLSAISRWNCSLLYWLPWSEWCSKAFGLPRRQIAISSAWYQQDNPTLRMKTNFTRDPITDSFQEPCTSKIDRIGRIRCRHFPSRAIYSFCAGLHEHFEEWTIKKVRGR